MLKPIAMLLLASCALQVQAAVPPGQAERLGRDLTPLGAERAGNAEGTIPAWTGGITKPPAGYKPGAHHIDPYAADQPLLIIDKNNLNNHRDKLPEGMQRLLTLYPDYGVRVYPSRRSAAVPERLYAATRQNATRAKLISGGNGIEGAAAGVPFPIPQDGLEVIWNHITRYRGEQLRMITNQAAVLANGSYNLLKLDREIYFVYNREGMTPSDLDNILYHYKYKITAPAKLAGSALVVQDSLDQVLATRKAWRFNRGERRVRRLPSLAYDSLQPDTNGMATADMVDVYNGAPNRYEWKLLGKREMIVPYNSYKVHQQGIPYEELLGDKTVNSSLLRYELHRVWVVEAPLRIGFKHPYAKRRFYIDEDSWQILSVDLYDEDGELIGLQEAHPINYYEVPVFVSTLETVYDLKGGRYFVDGLDNNEPPYNFGVRLTPRDFSAQALRLGN
ncbi:MAG TPA: DUF1329 domain-containing protein [Pseudomonas sp.]|nr:DUF1329 domain-containing protein [Pseudomonas sp.]